MVFNNLSGDEEWVQPATVSIYLPDGKKSKGRLEVELRCELDVRKPPNISPHSPYTQSV